MLKELLTKLTQRETWLEFSGIGLAIYGVISDQMVTIGSASLPDEAMLAPIITALLGAGSYVHVRRGQQRGEEVAAAAKKVWETVKAPQTDDGDEEEGPWD